MKMRVRIFQKFGSYKNNSSLPKLKMNKIGFIYYYTIVQEQFVYLWLKTINMTFISELQILYKVV